MHGTGRRLVRSTLLGAAAAACLAVPAAAQGCDPAAGERLFSRCATCHAAEPGRQRVGPSLFGVFGRPVASLPAYDYSDALRAYGAGGAVWDRDRLAAFLANPRGVVPGTRMGVAIVPQPGQRADVVCFLETLR